MRCFHALFCAALIFTPIHSLSASDIPLPQRKPVYTPIMADQISLAEARHLLEQISIELRKPATNRAPPAPQQTTAVAPPPHTAENLTLSRPQDLEMHCGALSQESLRMRDIIYKTQDVKDRAKMQSHGITAAGAVGSFLIGSVTGGVGLALGGFLLDQNVGGTSDDADGIQDIAEQRRTLMMGIFNAKGCEGPLEHAMQNPEIFDPLSRLAATETAAGGSDSVIYND